MNKEIEILLNEILLEMKKAANHGEESIKHLAELGKGMQEVTEMIIKIRKIMAIHDRRN